MDAARHTVVFILSTNYSGSHFLSLVLGSHTAAEHVGEIRRFEDEGMRKQACFLCGEGNVCPMFRGIKPGEISGIHGQIFANLPAHKTVLIDNSKKVAWARHFLDAPFEKKFIHLIRDPRALVRRWTLFYDERKHALHQRFRLARQWPARFFQIATAPKRLVYVYKWVEQNRGITRFLREHPLDHRLVTYRDSVREPAREVAALESWMGCDFEPPQLQYWNFEHHGSQKSEYQWVKDKPQNYFDARWREFLTPDEQQRITQHPDVGRYLQELNLRFVEDGLTRA